MYNTACMTLSITLSDKITLSVKLTTNFVLNYIIIMYSLSCLEQDIKSEVKNLNFRLRCCCFIHQKLNHIGFQFF